MNVFANIKRKRCSASISSAIALVCLCLIATSCATAYTFGALNGDMPAVSTIQNHCPDDETNEALAESDCCCDLTAALSTDATQLHNVGTSVALPTDFELLSSMRTSMVAIERLQPPPQGASPPVYLTTQRLRI